MKIIEKIQNHTKSSLLSILALLKNNEVLRRYALPNTSGRQHRQAFTLIELLVVVLIIGILTAAAVPMYEKSTLKAHFVQIQTTLNAMMRAIDAYTMENGYDTGDWSSLIQSVNCKSSNSDWGQFFCTTDERIYWTNGGNGTIHLNFAPNGNLFVVTSGTTYSLTKTDWTALDLDK